MDFSAYSQYDPNIFDTSDQDTPDYQFILVDGMHLFYRTYYAYKELKNSQGVFTGAIYGFLRSLLFFKENWGGKVVILWDGNPKSRQNAYSEYKAGRASSKDLEGFHSQRDMVSHILSHLNVIQVYDALSEADDLAIWLGRTLNKSMLFVSGDNDWLGVIDDSKKHHVYRPGYKEGQGIVLTEVNFEQNHPKKLISTKPSQIYLEKTISGDSSDNIKGIPRFSKKVLKTLLDHFYSTPRTAEYHDGLALDFFTEVVNKTIPLPASLYQKVVEFREVLSRNFELFRPVTPLSPLLRVGELDEVYLSPIFESLEIKSLKKINTL